MNLGAGKNTLNVQLQPGLIIAAANSSATWKAKAVEVCPGTGSDENVFAKYPNVLLAPGKYEVGVWLPANNNTRRLYRQHDVTRRLM